MRFPRSFLPFALLLLASHVEAELPGTLDESPIVPMAREEARDRLVQALPPDKPSRELLESMAAWWANDVALLDAVVRSAGVVEPRLQPLVESSVRGTSPTQESLTLLREEGIAPFLRFNVAVAVGIELVRQRLHDEALELFEAVDATEIVDPAAYYFHRAVCEFSLHQVAEARNSLDKLQRVPGIAARYRVVSDSMREVLADLKKESLGGIAHDMRDVERRLDLERPDEKTVALENDILERLDKLIDDLENQDKSDSGASGSSSPRSMAPARQSQLLGGKGEGKVDEKSFRDRGKWGNLPDKDRERAIQDIGRDFPGHYRDAIEQYFRKLATNPES